ncbi:hypothetical protein TW81_10050 [Vibrio galatheae]|uniref:diguanylate cyclase n=1 Tax=Vibrio galatheae TaxID=579748 RepID=A0A0F4NMJ4_9VIBR|nr:diguanylate cyclase [Vibrio galatheae]KJY83326.1 hypothetical protein TW81_10050 [Vibrio galatheae]
MFILRLFILCFPILGCVLATSSYAQNDFSYQVSYLKEQTNQRLSVEEVSQMFESGEGTKSDTGLLSFGVGSDPGWVKISVNNPTEHAIGQRLTTSVTWVNYLELYQVDANGNIENRSAGDAYPRTKEIQPSIGITFNVQLPIGESEFYIRAEANDPIVMPIQFLSTEDIADNDISKGILYGVLYGILLTLLGYNLILYRSLKQVNFAYYSIYIGSFIILNTGYNGYLFAWVHPDNFLLQNYLTLNMMVVHSALGLVFSLKFLDVKRHKARLIPWVFSYIGIGLAAILTSTLMGWHLVAVFIAFAYLGVSTLMMVILGLLHLTHVERANYFVIAVSMSMFGLFATAATNAGVIPFTYFGYHAAEYGVLFEAVVLAYLLSVDLKIKENARLRAEYLAAYDPLTNLLNRRSFFTFACKKIRQHQDNGMPISLVVLDIDHFKQVNDTYGHDVGDKALIHITGLLKKNIRQEDLIGRFGGEELLILLAKNDCTQATAFTERLRRILENSPLEIGGISINLTASFGVVECINKASIDEMIKRADALLYQAKENGRNQVVSASIAEELVTTR